MMNEEKSAWKRQRRPAVSSFCLLHFPKGAGIFVASSAIHGQSSVRSDISGNADGRCRPDGTPRRSKAKAGAEIYFGLGFYKYAAPDGALVGTLRGDVPAGAFPFLASGIFEQPARRGQECAGRRTAQRAPSLPRWPGTRVAVGKDPANGSLGWTNGTKGVARKNPKGISSFSPVLPDAIGLRRVTERKCNQP
jgi:hypothetical protein